MFNHKRIVVGLATALLAVGVAVGSGASFTSQTANPSNTFSSGVFTHSNSKNGAAIVTGSNMKPGDVKTGDVTITNTGTLAGVFKLNESAVSSTFTTGKLLLKIEDITNSASPTTVYSGNFGAVPAAGLSLGTFQPNEAHTYHYTVTFDSSAGDTDQGKSASADYTWSAVQA